MEEGVGGVLIDTSSTLGVHFLIVSPRGGVLYEQGRRGRRASTTTSHGGVGCR